MLFLCFGTAAAEACSIIFADTYGSVIALPDVILLKVLRPFLAFNPSDFIRTSSLVALQKNVCCCFNLHPNQSHSSLLPRSFESIPEKGQELLLALHQH